MTDRERTSLLLAADHAWKAQYDDLWRARSRASHALFLAKTMGDFGGPKLIAQRQQELKDADRRIREWILANPSSCSPQMLNDARSEDYLDRLAGQSGGNELAELKKRLAAD